MNMEPTIFAATRKVESYDSIIVLTGLPLFLNMV